MLPTFTVRQVVTTVNVWDNQTVVLGGLITSSVQSTKDKVPVLGDVPLLAAFSKARARPPEGQPDDFCDRDIVDPAGNRVHSDDELPFAQSSVPVQPAARR